MLSSSFLRQMFVQTLNVQKCFIMIQLTFLKVLMLIRQVNQKSVLFATIGIFKIKDLSFNQMPAMCVMKY